MSCEGLCLSGGGANGLIQLGCLHYMFFYGKLDSIKHYIGTSVGSIICLLLIVGYTPMEIFDNVSNMKNKIFYGGIKSLKDNWGASNIDNLINEIEKLIIKKINCIPTLKELSKITGKNLCIVCSNLTDFKTEYFDTENSEAFTCTELIKMSCNIPGLFSFLKINGKQYIDGGFGDNFPISHLEKKINGLKILGINTYSFNPFSDIKIPLVQYILKSLSFSFVEVQRLKREQLKYSYHQIIEIDTQNDVININFTKEQARDKFMLGYNKAKNIDSDWSEYINI